MNINLFDHPILRDNLLPFTFTRPVSEIRTGILAITEKWRLRTGYDVYHVTQEYLQEQYPASPEGAVYGINGCVCPDEALVDYILNMKEGSILFDGEIPIAWKGDTDDATEVMRGNWPADFKRETVDREIRTIRHPWDIFVHNREQVINDFDLVTRGRTSADIADAYTVVYGDKQLFVEEGAEVRAAVINADRGPVYIGKNAQVLEGAIIRGATALGEHAILNVAGRIVGDSSIGPHCKVGGEVSNSVIFGYSSKAHDGFIGNSVLGEWCNLGADTNTSNLKNNYRDIKLWNYRAEAYLPTDRRFCGLMMGDHSKCGINTMFNTGTVAGVGANVFGAGFQSKFIPSFSWGGPQGRTTYELDKFLEMVRRVYDRKNKDLQETARRILTRIFEDTKKYRNW